MDNLYWKGDLVVVKTFIPLKGGVIDPSQLELVRPAPPTSPVIESPPSSPNKPPPPTSPSPLPSPPTSPSPPPTPLQPPSPPNAPPPPPFPPHAQVRPILTAAPYNVKHACSCIGGAGSPTCVTINNNDELVMASGSAVGVLLCNGDNPTDWRRFGITNPFCVVVDGPNCGAAYLLGTGPGQPSWVPNYRTLPRGTGYYRNCENCTLEHFLN